MYISLLEGKKIERKMVKKNVVDPSLKKLFCKSCDLLLFFFGLLNSIQHLIKKSHFHQS